MLPLFFFFLAAALPPQVVPCVPLIKRAEMETSEESAVYAVRCQARPLFHHDLSFSVPPLSSREREGQTRKSCHHRQCYTHTHILSSMLLELVRREREKHVRKSSLCELSIYLSLFPLRRCRPFYKYRRGIQGQRKRERESVSVRFFFLRAGRCECMCKPAGVVGRAVDLSFNTLRGAQSGRVVCMCVS